MAGLVVGALAKAGVGQVVVASRTSQRALRLAETVDGRCVPLAELPAALAAADLVVASAGAAGRLVSAEQAAAARAADRPQVYLDLALPRDVDPAVAELEGVELVDLESLGELLAGHPVLAELAAVEEIVSQEVVGHQAEQRAASVAPTVVALRERARSVVEAELLRLDSRLGIVDERVRAELTATVHRVVDKLLHTPTVRIKELAGEPGGDSYADALRALFDLQLDRLPAAGAIFPDPQQVRR